MATIYDVAKEAGVSPKTVSRVLNGDAPVNAKTRESVRQAMELLAYVPSSAARSMRSNRTGLVGLITGAISDSGALMARSGLPGLLIVQAIQKALSDASLTLLISDTGGETDRIPVLLQTFAEHRVEAVVYVAEYHRQVTLMRSVTGCPLVLVNCFDDAGNPSVVPDDFSGQCSLVSKLVAAGHRRVGFLTLPEGMVAEEQRLRGYKRALEEAGIAYDPALVCPTGLHHAAPPQASLVTEAASRMMKLEDPPTVFCCGNDQMAMQLYGVLRTTGFSVPGDVSVAGFDDHRIISETLFPPLTTAVLPYEDMGRQAAELLLGNLRGGKSFPREKVSVSGPVVWRQSVAAPLRAPKNFHTNR